MMKLLDMSMGKWVVENKITKGVESNLFYTSYKTQGPNYQICYMIY